VLRVVQESRGFNPCTPHFLPYPLCLDLAVRSPEPGSTGNPDAHIGGSSLASQQTMNATPAYTLCERRRCCTSQVSSPSIQSQAVCREGAAAAHPLPAPGGSRAAAGASLPVLPRILLAGAEEGTWLPCRERAGVQGSEVACFMASKLRQTQMLLSRPCRSLQHTLHCFRLFLGHAWNTAKTLEKRVATSGLPALTSPCREKD